MRPDMLFVGGSGGERVRCRRRRRVVVGRIAFPEWGIVTGHADEGERERQRSRQERNLRWGHTSAERERGRVHKTSAKFSGFLTPPPPLHLHFMYCSSAKLANFSTPPPPLTADVLCTSSLIVVNKVLLP